MRLDCSSAHKYIHRPLTDLLKLVTQTHTFSPSIPFLYPFGTGVLHLIQINHKPDATIFQFIILTFVHSSTCFGLFPAHHQELNDWSGSLWFYLRIVVMVVLCLWSGRPARPRTQHGRYHDMKAKPEAATAVIELLMMVGKTPKTS
jgi:fumarate reductase subunit D